MRIFVTGATGFVGSAVAARLIEAGHAVTGLARSDRSAAALEASGIGVLRGDLTDLASLTRGAADADAVIHTGFIHDFLRGEGSFAASIEADRQAVATLGTALAGSDRALVVTSGTAVLPRGEPGTEDSPAATEGHAAGRGGTETLALGFADRGVRVMIMRLPPSVHGDGDHGFVPMLIDAARRRGLSGYIGAGDNRWAAVYRDDAALAYARAIERGVAGSRYHAVAEEEIPLRDIATVIGRKLGVPVASVPAADAADHFGGIVAFAGMDTPATGALTRQRLDWHPTGPRLLDDLEHGRYFG